MGSNTSKVKKGKTDEQNVEADSGAKEPVNCQASKSSSSINGTKLSASCSVEKSPEPSYVYKRQGFVSVYRLNVFVQFIYVQRLCRKVLA